MTFFSALGLNTKYDPFHLSIDKSIAIFMMHITGSSLLGYHDYLVSIFMDSYFDILLYSVLNQSTVVK